MTREQAQAFSAEMREAFRNNTSKVESFLSGLAAGHIERLVREKEAVRAAFLAYVKAENRCNAARPCIDVNRCGCALEMQAAIAEVERVQE